MDAANFAEDRPASSFSRWLLPALIVSLFVHGLFWHWARRVTLLPPAREYYERIVPRTFHLQRVEIDAKLLAPEPQKDKQEALSPEAVALPQEEAAFEKLMAESKGAPSAPTIESPILSEKPSAAATTFEQTSEIAQKSGALKLLEDSDSLQKALLADKPDAGARPLGKLLDPEALTGRAVTRTGQLRGGDTPGFSNLDQLLAKTGPLSPETAPILMPTDLLFDYDEANLRPEALASLEKLGTLIRRNPQAAFVIEGHTDSFGSDEYNFDLSNRRAQSVKQWLVAAMQIPAGKIQARGFGESKLIAPAVGSIEDQQINRRVEIVIRAAGTN